MTFKKGDTYKNEFGVVITIIEEPDKLNQVTARTVINLLDETSCVNADSLENLLTKNGYVKEG